ncbi:MAG: GNAT family N-acetyltransferase [Pyrinomonadaceae bacterium]
MKPIVITKYPDPQLEERWNEFLKNAHRPTHYTTPNFMVDPFIRGGERLAILAEDEGGRISGVITGVIDEKNFRSGMAVRPQAAFRKDIDLRDTASTMFEGLGSIGDKKLDFIEFYTWDPVPEFVDLGFREKICGGDNSVVMLDLTKGADELFKEFSQTRRNEIRKVIRKGELEVKTLETEDELRELYEIHVDWNKRKEIKPDSFKDFSFAQDQTEYRKTLIAKHDGKVIAGSYYRFCRGGMIEYAANNSLVEYQKLRPNDLIGWRSIEWACEAEFTEYSMGGSHLFLRRFGGDLVHAYRYKMDLSFLHVHDAKESIVNLGLKTYRNLPKSVKSGIKKIAGKK